MQNEPDELTNARALLARFEAEMNRPEGLVHLQEALSILADIRGHHESGDVNQIASNLPLAYARKVQARVEPFLSSEQPIHWETVEHWLKIFQEFENSEFVLPQDIAETRSKLLMEKMKREIGLMSRAERKKFLEQLQAVDDK